MALSKSVLSGLLQTDLAAVFTILDAAELKKACDAIADAVVTHITGAAVVVGTVTSGAGSGGAVTGTVT